MKKIFLFFLLASGIYAQQTIDRIVAVVDNDIILQSELEFRANVEAAQRQLPQIDSTLLRNVLIRMVEEKLLYAQAELDSVVVSDDQVKSQLDYQINYFIQQYGSQEKLEEAYGMPVEKIKRVLRDDTRKNLMAQMLQQKKFGEIQVSRKEVEDFYEVYKDSLGMVPEKFELAHIFQNPKTGEQTKKRAYEFARSLLDSLIQGADFAYLARKYSDDPGSASEGGDLGYVKRGVFYPQFEAAAFSLAPNQISDIVETPVGYHIIQLLDRRGESIHVRHILVKLKADDEADLKAIEFLNEIRDSILAGHNTFEYYAKKYSDDKESAKFGGKLGIFEASQLDKSLLDLIYKMKEGDISYPKRMELDPTSYGYHIVKLIRRIPQHKPNLEQDYDELKRLAEYYKRQKIYNEWMQEIKKRIYWEIRL
ncbi:Parvulin-like peptidyl-prolyl isomerase [Melioribacter roseus P3M-2]|uniref:Parvulin-like peptidyl-prolyl isomerase n=1 Tax=Melioribacter roseus (strain DSM 23840 / JCM 17771 / VKM B-2668 / P3M-2) TaxID=1191523 RepID=I6ZN69_MELRP|nr:peptidylprolyl isomerase [Melioribacter roseus]AFN73414.1 Parvulin-like peptidyl-prolyl isomerase [Melioribacter roseus P3M-2]